MSKRSSLRKEGYVRFPVPAYIAGTVSRLLAQTPDGYVIGGWARNLLSLVIGGRFVEERASDVDLLVIGTSCPEGLEDDVQASSSLDDYFSSRDFTANQVAVSQTEIIATRKAVSDHLNGRIRLVGCWKDLWEDDMGNRIPSPRVSFRAVRFAAHFGLPLPRLPSWELGFDGVLQGWKALQKSPEEFDRYLRIVGVTVESFIWEARTVALRDEAELLDAIYEAYPHLG